MRQRKAVRRVAAAALIAVASLAGVYWAHVRNEFFVILGSRNETGGWYGFHSGFGGSWIPQYIGLALVLWWHQQCHVTGCYWPSRRRTAAGELVCFRHNPEPIRTVHDIHRAHHAAKAKTLEPGD